MNDIIGYLLKSINSSTLSLKKKGVLIDKPWALIDNDGEIQKLIFKKDKGLILSKNGQVTEGGWDYFPEAKALLINRGNDKILLKEQYIDDNVLILKKDGTNNEFFALANENTIPNYNIPKYLNSLKCKQFKIQERNLISGNRIQIHNAYFDESVKDYIKKSIELVDKDFNKLEVSDSSHMTSDKRHTIYIQNRKVISVSINYIIKSTENISFEIENGNIHSARKNTNKKITKNGSPVLTTRLVDTNNLAYKIKDSIIQEISFIHSYELKNGIKIKVEQQKKSKIKKGDRIIELESNSSLPDGIYKLKGKWRKVKVINNKIA